MFYDSSCWNLSTAGRQWTSIAAACWWHYPCGCGRRVACMEKDDIEEVIYWPDSVFFFSLHIWHEWGLFWWYETRPVCAHEAVKQLKTREGLTQWPTFRPMKRAFRDQWGMFHTKDQGGTEGGIGETKRRTLGLFVVDRISWLKGKTTNIWSAPQPNGLIVFIRLVPYRFQACELPF